MALFISFRNRRRGEGDFYRFKTAFILLSELFKDMKIEHKSMLAYRYEPLLELNEDFERVSYKFGLLESYMRRKIEELGKESDTLGLEIESTLTIKEKIFNLVFTLLPRYKESHYDIRIEIIPNGYAEVFEDLEIYNQDLRKLILERIKKHNDNVEFRKNTELFTIRRVVMSDYTDELHNIDKWKMFYSKKPSELIIHISASSEEINKRLIFANREKFAETLNEFEPFIWKVSQYAKEANVELAGGSISIIPKDERSMKVFIDKLRDKINSVAKEIYLTKDEYEEKLQKSLSD